mgnify:CR=1 FL=1
MAEKKIFKKKQKFLFKYFFYLIFFLFVFIIFFKFNYKNEYFEIPEFSKSFYIIPEDLGGKKIANLNKKILHMDNNENVEIDLNDYSSVKYSIQFFASSDYNQVKNQLEFFIKSSYLDQNLTLKLGNFSILFFDYDFGSEYLLLYKNFETNILAKNYCLKYLVFLDKCIIVDAQNLD